jgi:hypothetical protein
MSLSSFIAKIAQNTDFGYFMAHSMTAYFVTHQLLRLGYIWPTVIGLVTIAAWKEFYWDMRNETNPPQTYADGALDFSGYATGIVLGVFL